MMTPALALLWLTLGTTSLVFTLATDEPPLTRRKVAVAYTLGPFAVAIGAVVLTLAALKKTL